MSGNVNIAERQFYVCKGIIMSMNVPESMRWSQMNNQKLSGKRKRAYFLGITARLYKKDAQRGMAVYARGPTALGMTLKA